MGYPGLSSSAKQYTKVTKDSDEIAYSKAPIISRTEIEFIYSTNALASTSTCKDWEMVARRSELEKTRNNRAESESISKSVLHK